MPIFSATTFECTGFLFSCTVVCSLPLELERPASFATSARFDYIHRPTTAGRWCVCVSAALPRVVVVCLVPGTILDPFPLDG